MGELVTAGPHRILRQVLELDLRVPLEAAPALQELAARPFRDASLPGLEALFDRLAGPDRLIRLERLELDLGELRGRDWPRQLVERLAEQLAERLQEALPADGESPADRSSGGTGSPAPAATAGRQAPPSSRDPLAALLSFLDHGHLPWWASRPAGDWHAAPPAAFEIGAGRLIAERLRRRPVLAERLTEVAGDPLLAALVAALAGPGGAEEALHRLAPEGASPGDRRWADWRRRFWTDLLAAAPSLGGSAAGGAPLLRRWLAARPRTEPSPAPSSLPALPAPWREWQEAAAAAPPGASRLHESPGASRLYERASASRLDEGRREDGDDRSGASRWDGRGAGAAKDATPGAALSGASRWDERHREALPAGAAPTPAGSPAGAGCWHEPAAGYRSAGAAAAIGAAEEVYLIGAGLVILHPFLPELFASRGLLAERKSFRGEAERHHAVRLLGQLAFGGAAPEYDLLLPKLLCGLAWETVLAPAELDETDLAACGELLAAVLRHWTALKSASPEWLREQFLIRGGKLEPVDGGFRLTVESRAQDVLLTRLPWGLGTVRLPFMAANLHIGWIG